VAEEGGWRKEANAGKEEKEGKRTVGIYLHKFLK
jgi:hypothetical protein